MAVGRSLQRGAKRRRARHYAVDDAISWSFDLKDPTDQEARKSQHHPRHIYRPRDRRDAEHLAPGVLARHVASGRNWTLPGVVGALEDVLSPISDAL
ncbi:MAG: hypothetical protein AAF813_01510 [Pseudomonadota bacterium]